MTSRPPESTSASAGGWLSTNLPPAAVAGLLAFSVALFLLWGGPLWEASPDASHLGRILGSYLAVVPAAAAALAFRRRFALDALVTVTGAVWAAKVVVTIVLFRLFAPGTARSYDPARAALPETGRAAPARYVPAPADFPAGAIEGVVTAGGRPLPASLVHLVDPSPGLPSPPPRDVPLRLRSGVAAPAPLSLGRDDRLLVSSADGELHTFHLRRDGAGSRNVPIPASGDAVVVDPLRAGTWDAACDAHPGETARIVAADHPYVAAPDPEGRFRLDAVPAGTAHLRAVAVGEEVEARAVLVAGRTTVVPLALDTDPLAGSARPPRDVQEIARR